MAAISTVERAAACMAKLVVLHVAHFAELFGADNANKNLVLAVRELI